MADSQTHTAALLLPSFPSSGVYKSPSDRGGDAKDGTCKGQGWVSTPPPWELTKEAAPLLVAQGCRRGRAAVAAPLGLPTELIPTTMHSCHHALSPTTRAAAAVQLRLVPKALVVFPSVQPALAQPQREQVSNDSQLWPG